MPDVTIAGISGLFPCGSTIKSVLGHAVVVCNSMMNGGMMSGGMMVWGFLLDGDPRDRKR